MNKKHIEYNNLIAKLIAKEYFSPSSEISYDELIKLLNSQPIADVQEVKHAKWELIDECANEGVYCSNCHKKVYRAKYANQKIKSNYCPNCGAKMDKE